MALILDGTNGLFGDVTGGDISGNFIIDSVKLQDASVTESKIASNAVTEAKIAPITTTGTTAPRNLQDRFADVVNVKDFGAVGDYTTDDTGAIQAAINSLPANGGTIYLPSGRYRTTSTILIDKELVRIIGDGGGHGANTLGIETLNNVSVCEPLGATQIIGDFVTGSVIRIKKPGASIQNLTIDSTSGTSGGNSPISTGASGRKGGSLTSHGIELMTDDISGGSVARFYIHNVGVFNQPGDGIICIDNIVSSRIDFTSIICCNRHALNIQGGKYLGRTNTTKPGQVQLNNISANRCGGHGLLVGGLYETDTGDAPYRIEINNYESFYNLITPSLAMDAVNPSNGFISGENHVMIDSAFDGRTRFGGVTVAAYNSLFVQGRLINIINYRAIDCTPHGIYIGKSPSLGTRGIKVDNYYQNKTVAPSSDPAIYISDVDARYVSASSPYITTAYINLTNKFSGSGYYQRYSFDVESDLVQTHRTINSPEINSDVYRSTIDPREISISNNAAFYIEFDGPSRGFLHVSGNTLPRKSGIFHFRTGDGSAGAEKIGGSATNVATTIGALNGTTGSVGNLTFSVDNTLNRVYIENRTGADGAYTFVITNMNQGRKINAYAII